MQVRELMTESPACCTPDTDLQKVAQMMVEHDCGAIPIVESTDSGRPLGVVTDRDITVRIVAQGQNPLQMRAQDAMTKEVVTVSPETDVEEAARAMKDNQVRRLLVVDDREGCVGMIAQADLARRTSAEEVGGMVEAVSKPSAAASRPSAG